MKKTVDCIIILTILMISSVCLAASAKEIYFNGDKNYIQYDSGMGRIWYVIVNTVNVQKYNPPEYIVAIDVVQVNPENNTMGKPWTVRFLYNYDLQKMYIESYNPDNRTYYWDYLKNPQESVKYHVSSVPIGMGELVFAIAYNMSFYKDGPLSEYAKRYFETLK
ncbi:hypothetical protein [Megamonas hypermegale]|uniref:hypothetical protein n=1 Tax=Megamonas hypermegale TaxID=158847 RepID=UPI0032098BF1